MVAERRHSSLGCWLSIMLVAERQKNMYLGDPILEQNTSETERC